MSFRIFVYYCALGGGWAALVGWFLGTYVITSTGWVQSAEPQTDFRRVALFGLLLGLFVACALGLIDALWNLTFRQFGKILGRVMTAVLIGSLGGLIGALVGQAILRTLTERGQQSDFVGLLLGYALAGFLVGMSIGFPDFLAALLSGTDFKAGMTKLVKCGLGGLLGGLIGSQFAAGSKFVLLSLFSNKQETDLWSPTAIGFVMIGAMIGLLVGLAQVLFKEAWVKVEAGFRAGRELIVTKEATTVGRAEGSDIALFGDNGVEKLHAKIVRANGKFYLQPEDGLPDDSLYLNDQPVRSRMLLMGDDLIRLGKRSALRFLLKK